MSGLSVLINELLNLIDGPKIPFGGGGVDLPSNIKEYRGKEINTGVKGIVNTMDNSVGGSGCLICSGLLSTTNFFIICIIYS